MAMSDMSTKSTLIFLHIPKTAGTTMRSIIRRQYSPEELYAVEDPDWVSKNAEFFLKSKKNNSGIRCLIGHFPYGVHHYLPDPAQYITILRNPVEWTLSTYSDISSKQVTAVRYLKQAALDGIKLADFPQFLVDNGLANPQTRAVAGFVDVAHMGPPHPPLPPNALQVARDNIGSNNVAAGVVERFDESVVLFKMKLGWHNVCYRHQNATQKRIRREELSPTLIERITRCHALDFQLYEEVNRRLDSQISGHEPEFSRQLHRFKRINRYYQTISRCLGPSGSHMAGRAYAFLRSLRRR
jgi:Galactose-3-O-sulfotransferase